MIDSLCTPRIKNDAEISTRNEILSFTVRYSNMLKQSKNQEEDQKQHITSDTDTIKGETHSNIRERNDRSKGQRQVVSNRPGTKLDYGLRIEVNSIKVKP